MRKLVNSVKNLAIIPAAGNPKLSLFPNTFDPLIPINGVPAIKYILDSLKKLNLAKIIIILNEKDSKSKKFIEFLNEKNVIIKIAKNKFRGVGDSIYTAIENLDVDVENIIINLGDTIFKNQIQIDKDYILVSNKSELESSNWDYILDDGKTIIKKPKQYESGKITCGVYNFSDWRYLKRIFQEYKKGDELSITDLLKKYTEKNKFKLIEEKNDWFDLGHLEGYYSAKISFLRKRGFNRLQYDPFKGSITKRSTNHQKILQEVNWYINLPDSIKIFSPRLIDYNLNKEDAYYSIEFYGYPSLGDLFLYGNLSEEHWFSIFKKIFNFILHLKNNYSVELPKKNYIKIYVEKTIERLNSLRKDVFFNELLNFNKITVNGKNYDNLPNKINLNHLNRVLEQIFEGSNSSIMHGDLCFSNILYDIYSGLMKLIDPRGGFGTTNIFGDLNYDLAKLRHSIHGNYEAIISDLFNIQNKNNNFNYSMFNNSDTKIIAEFDLLLKENNFNIELVKYIEGLLFLTMIPLHSDSFERQKMMYIRSVELFNEIKGDYFENCN